MNLRMAVQAGASQQEAVVEVVVCFLAGVSLAGVAGRRVALLAQDGWPLDQQGRVVAAVRLVAQRAVLGGRCVLPQERSAFFRVAEKTGCVDSRTLQQKVVVAIVRIMAAAAGHAAKTQWMAAGFQSVRAFIRMAGETGLLLFQCIEHRVSPGMHLVTGRTG